MGPPTPGDVVLPPEEGCARLGGVEAVTWSRIVLDADDGDAPLTHLTHRDDAVAPVASVGKLLLLLEVGRQLDAGDLDPDRPLSRTGLEPIGDSGIWYRLATDTLPLRDVALLVGTWSDNLATNALLDLVGLDAVDATRRALGLRYTRLLDRVREVRGPEHAPTLATGAARELATLMLAIRRGTALTPGASAFTAACLDGGLDLSLVASAFRLDPLAHRTADGDGSSGVGDGAHGGGIAVANKTGTDAGIRADVGVVVGPNRTLAYACLASWDPALDRDGALTAHAVEGMRAFGALLRGQL